MADRIDLVEGFIDYGVNGQRIVSVTADPAELRLGCTYHDAAGGKLSGDWVRHDGVSEECVLVQFKLDERYRGTALLAGEITIHLRRPGVDNDAAMVPVLTLRHDVGVFHVPIAGASAGAGGQDILRSPGGTHWAVVQDDGQLVVYRGAGPHVHSVPVWSSTIGSIR